MNLGAPEMIALVLIVVVLFGSAQLPKLARSISQAQREFKRGVNGSDDDNA